MSNLSDNQMRAVTTTKKKVVVHSGAGAGKTACLAARIKWLLQNGYKPNEIVAITYTNNAADTMMQRVGNIPNLKICTLHSYANYLLTVGCISTAEVLENQKFDELFDLVEKHPECIQPVRVMLIDEAHDLSQLELKFIFDIIKPEEWMMFFDEKQHIYSFKEEKNNKVGTYGMDFGLNLMKQRDVDVIEFYENFRNASDILDFARTLIAPPGCPFYDSTRATRGYAGKVVKGTYLTNEECCKVSQFFKIYNHKMNGDYKDWFILVRSNKEIDDIATYFQALDPPIPCDTFKQSQLDVAGIEEKLEENTVKILTIHSAKGLENKYVIVVDTMWDSDIDKDRLRYVGATRAKDLLIWLKPGRNYTVKGKKHSKKEWFS